MRWSMKYSYYAKLPGTAKKDRIGGGYWLATFQDGLIWLSNQGLTAQQWNVLARLMGRLNFDNYITVNQTALAKELHTKKPNISTAIKKLVELNIITEGPRAGLNKTYVLNPSLGLKGKQRQQKIIDYEELRAKHKAKKQQDKSEV